MDKNIKIICFLGILLILGTIYLVGAFSKPARVDKSSASPEINRDQKTTGQEISEELVFSEPLVYFPESK